jgi:RecB family endonuclease NucS
MRMVIASCSVTYTGRGDTQLTRATRAIFLKTDGAVSIHSDFGNKPLNYMGKGNVHSEAFMEDGTLVWSFDTRKESIQIVLHEVYTDSEHRLEEVEPGLTRDGTEDQLQAWLAEHPEALGEGYTTVQREYPTGAGPVDLLVQDANGTPVAVEVKRVAMIDAVDQVSRYVEALLTEQGFREVRGIVAALDVRPKTRLLLQKRGFEWVTLPAHWRTEVEGGEEA